MERIGMTQLDKDRALKCFGGRAERTDPDAKARIGPRDECNCKNCNSWDYCCKLAETLV